MNREWSSRRAVLALSVLALLLLPPAGEVLAEPHVYFFDDFNGSALNENVWQSTGLRYSAEVWVMPPAETNYGTITVADSRLTLDNSSPTLSYPIFPFLWTNQAIPPSGDFELTLRMRYTKGGFWGDGVRIVAMPSAFDAPTLGSSESPLGQYVLMIHQDNLDCPGPNVSFLGRSGLGLRSSFFNTDWHTYTLRYEGNQASLYIDNMFVRGPAPAPRPNFISLGVSDAGCCAESCGCCGCQWTSLTIDFIRVRFMRETSAKASSWGSLKTRYR